MQESTRSNVVVAVVTGCLLLGGATDAQEDKVNKQHDYLKIVKNYADTLLESGRDTYGNEKSPLFVASLDRTSLAPGNFPGIAGIRDHDRSLYCANPMHDENLYQILYALTTITGDKKYATEADKALKFFFERCQSPETGLMAWGEHLGWHVGGERPHGGIMFRGKPLYTHEFFRPWILWDRCYDLTPEAALKFSKGLWEHQIANHETGDFSRHALWEKHGPGGQNEYPRHGGFYILTWGGAYRETKEEVYAKAVETLVDRYNRLSPEKTGAIPCCSKIPQVMWPESNLSLAIDLTDSAPVFPEALRRKMLARAAKTDEVYLSLKHDFTPGGLGFVAGANPETLVACTEGPWTRTQQWATGYGKTTDAQAANICYLRYRQLDDGPAKKGFGRLILACADRYLESTPDLKGTIFPGPMGDVIHHMLAAHEISGDKKYLDRADVFAGIAVDNFLSDGAPLPKASSQHNHYEAITRGDTMMIGLLKLWLTRNKPDLTIDLVYTDR